MQKQINMNAKTLVYMVLKPTMRKKFEFDEILNVTFIANFKEDTLNLLGSGNVKGRLEPVKRETEQMKLSENSTYIELFLTEIKKSIEYKTISAVYFKINFIDKTTESDVFYINKSDVKSSAKIKLNL